jgi:ABC-2 type transport system permease protein
VHAGWDRPKAETMQRFLAHYPEFADRAEVGNGFQWHWYFAFQHLGDLHVAADSAARDAGIARREALAQGLGWLLPPLKLTQGLQSLAGSDVTAELAFRARIRAFHRQLRDYHYPFLFDERPMTAADVAAAPTFETPPDL